MTKCFILNGVILPKDYAEQLIFAVAYQGQSMKCDITYTKIGNRLIEGYE